MNSSRSWQRRGDCCPVGDEEARDYPLFGHKEDDYEDVVRPFYAAWNGFATKKSYSWKDEYRLSDAPDRRIRRLMEKENKRIRESAIQEFNDAVRSLVAFVRKRDPRYQDNQKSEAERQKILRDAAAAQAQRSRAARQAKLAELDQMAVPSWAQSRSKDEHEGGFSSESDEEEHQYECVVCDKVFKSEAQLDAHERSKKHLKLVKELKVEMQHDDENMNGAGTGEDVSAQNEDHVDEEDDRVNGVTIEKDASAEIEAQNNRENKNRSDGETDADELHRNGIADISSANPPIQDPDDNSKDSDEDDDDYAPRSEVQERLTADPPSELASRLAATALDSTPLTSDTESASTTQPKVGKAKLKRAKKLRQVKRRPPLMECLAKAMMNFDVLCAKRAFHPRRSCSTTSSPRGMQHPFRRSKVVERKVERGRRGNIDLASGVCTDTMIMCRWERNLSIA